MLRRLTVAATLIGGLVALAAPAQAATPAPTVTVYKPAATPAGSKFTVRAKATRGSTCAIGITGVLSYGHSKHPTSASNLTWTYTAPSSASRGNHSVKVSCVKSGKRTTKYTTLYIKRWVAIDTRYGSGEDTFDLNAPAGTYRIAYSWSSYDEALFFNVDFDVVWWGAVSPFSHFSEFDPNSGDASGQATQTVTIRATDTTPTVHISQSDNVLYTEPWAYWEFSLLALR
jgi:hypothetical protein